MPSGEFPGAGRWPCSRGAFRGEPGADGEALRAQSPFGRVGAPEEIAEAICYLTASGAQWASGTILDLNGAPTCAAEARGHCGASDSSTISSAPKISTTASSVPRQRISCPSGVVSRCSSP